MPPALLDELVEEVLLRLPPDEPAGLVRAALVCRRWRRLVSDPGFHRRFREFHRRPPVLGMFCNRSTQFVPMTAFCFLQADRGCLPALDARSPATAVFSSVGEGDAASLSGTPSQMRSVGFRFRSCSRASMVLPFSALLLPAPATTFIATIDPSSWFLCALHFRVGRPWSTPIHPMLLLGVIQYVLSNMVTIYKVDFMMGSALVGNTVYFGSLSADTALKYNLELRQMSWIQLPSPSQSQSCPSVLTTTEDGALGLVSEDDSKLYMWSRKDTHEVDAIWERRDIIELNTVFPDDVALTRVFVIGSADGQGIVFMWVDGAVYTIDLKTYKVKKVYKGTTGLVLPYMSFYTPAFGGTCTGEGPSASHSSA